MAVPQGTRYFPQGTLYRPTNVLSSWARSLAAVQAATANAIIACVGDSTTAGGWSNGTQSGLWSLAYPALLANSLNAVAPANANSFFGDLNITAFASFAAHDPRITQGSGWAPTTVVLGAKDFFNNSTTGIFSFLPTVSYDTLDYYYLGNNGSFNINLNGGANTLVNTAGGSVALRSATITGSLIAQASNVVRVTSGTPHMVGQIARTAAVKQVAVTNLGYYGGTSANLAANSNTWDPIPSLALLAPQLTIIDLGINDMLTAVPLATTLANIVTIIKAAKPTGSVIVMSPNPIDPAQSGASQPVQDALAAGLQTTAAQNNCAFVNLSTAMGGSFAAANAAGYMADANHPGPLGYPVIAAAVAPYVVSPPL